MSDNSINNHTSIRRSSSDENNSNATVIVHYDFNQNDPHNTPDQSSVSQRFTEKKQPFERSTFSSGPLLNDTDDPSHRGRSESDLDIPIGVLGKDIINVRPLGAEGGMSNLFRAHKVGLDIDDVIKRTKRSFQSKIDERSEARIMTALSHQYLPKIFDLQTAADGYTYTIMEYIEGGTLRQYVDEHGAVPERMAYHWICQLCEVIAYMHSRKPNGIIHSDLKPENIMIRPNGDICVIDFNASLEASDEEAALNAIGASVGFAAPEQYNVDLVKISPGSKIYPFVKAARGYGKVTFSTDIYSIGALAYYMLTGARPHPWFIGNPPLDQLGIQVGDIFRVIIGKAMQPYPKDRYASVEDMYHSLTDLKQNDVRYKSWKIQRLIAIILVTLGIAAGAALIVAGIYTMQKEARQSYDDQVAMGSQLLNDGQLSDAETTLKSAVDSMPEFADAYLELGSVYFHEGQYEDAINTAMSIPTTALTGSKSSDNTNIAGQQAYLVAQSYMQLGDYQTAAGYYDIAVNKLPDNAECLRNAAICYIKLGNNEQVAKLIASLQALPDTEQNIAIVNGESSFAAGDYEKAFNSLSAAVSASKDLETIRYAAIEAANCCDQLGKDWIDKEIALLRSAADKLKASYSRTDVVTCLAEACLNKAAALDSDEADAYLQEALDCYNDLEKGGYLTMISRLNKAMALQGLGQYEESASVLDALAKDYPDQYRVPMRQAMLVIAEQGAKDRDQRDYSDFTVYYETAEKLYQKSGATDSNMNQLESINQDLKDQGWLK